MITANCDWEFVVAQMAGVPHASGQWFGAARAHGWKSEPLVTRPNGSEELTRFHGTRLHTPWMPTELAAREAIEALVAMEG
jgi:hypothetical protein